jgi:hypothetical protein
MVPGNVLVPLGEFAAAKAQAIRLYASQSAIRDWATFALGLNASECSLYPAQLQRSSRRSSFSASDGPLSRRCQDLLRRCASRPVNVIVSKAISPDDHRVWKSYLEQRTDRPPLGGPEWAEPIRKGYGRELECLIARDPAGRTMAFWHL